MAIQLSPEQFESLLPRASAWAGEQERRILAEGCPLTQQQLADAKRLSITFPERIRLLKVKTIPIPPEPDLRQAALATGLISPATVGLTLRYGIFIRSDYWGDRFLVAHELAHTRQYETLGGIEPFLRQYLLECVTIGYPDAPMEQEAIRFAEATRNCQRPSST